MPFYDRVGHSSRLSPELASTRLSGVDGSRPAHRGDSQGVDHHAERDHISSLLKTLTGATPQQRHVIRDEVVRFHLGLATSAARRYHYVGDLDDLVQVARVALVEAFDRYDPARASFPSFAWVTMTGALRRHLRDHGWALRPPRSIQETANTMRAATPRLTQQLGRVPSTRDLATQLGLDVALVRSAQQAQRGIRSDSIDAVQDEGWVAEHLAEWHLVETRVVLARAIRDLTPEQRDLLRMRFFDDMTQTEIAAAIGAGQMQVSRLLAKVLAQLRTSIGALDHGPS